MIRCLSSTVLSALNIAAWVEIIFLVDKTGESSLFIELYPLELIFFPCQRILSRDKFFIPCRCQITTACLRSYRNAFTHKGFLCMPDREHCNQNCRELLYLVGLGYIDLLQCTFTMLVINKLYIFYIM